MVQIPLGNDLIHAPTGAVLLQLRWLCLEAGTIRSTGWNSRFSPGSNAEPARKSDKSAINPHNRR